MTTSTTQAPDPSTGAQNLAPQTADAEAGEGQASTVPFAGSLAAVSTGGGDAGRTAGFVVLFLYVRLMAVSGWQWDTAASIADSFSFSDAVPIVFGTLFELPALTGALLALVLPLALFRLYWLSRHKRFGSAMTDVFLAVAIIATMFVLYRSEKIWWPFIVGLLLAAALLITSRVYRANAEAREFFSLVGKHVGRVVVVALMFLAVFVTTPWMPHETIVTDDGKITGYVLESSPGFLRVLTDDREVLILPDGEVTSRTDSGR